MSLIRFALLCFVVAAASARKTTEGAGCDETCCPKNWLGYNGFCYRHFAMKKSWYDARAFCQGLNLGADLASIRSDEEDHILDGYLAGDSAWIGLSDLESEGTFSWSDGTHYHFNHFESPQPDNAGGNQHCVRVGGEDIHGCWEDAECTELGPFLCKI